MLAGISSKLDRWARGRYVLALIVALVVFEVITLPILQRSPGGDIVSLDARFFYTPQEAFSTVALYGDARPFWIGIYLTWDVANPILYTSILCLAISWLFQRGFKAESRLQRLNLVPLVAGTLDLIENACIVTLLAAYPTQYAFVAWIASLCTMGKVTTIGVSFLLVVFGLIVLAMNKLRDRSDRQ